MKPAQLPISEESWMALEKETVDALVIRRRMGEKSAIRKVEQEDEKEAEKSEDRKRRVNLLRVIEQEMRLMIVDDPKFAAEEMKITHKLKKMAEVPNEEEEILQTHILSQKEVSENWEDWLTAAGGEVDSMLTEKEAFREIFPEELQKLKEEAEKTGGEIEFIPSKLVFMKKPGPAGGKKKMTWVICGNWETRRDDEDNFSRCRRSRTTNSGVVCVPTLMGSAGSGCPHGFPECQVQSEDEPLIVVKPPSLLVEKVYLRRDVYYLPEKAVYGLRRSPRLWSITGDETMSTFHIQGEHNGKLMNFHLQPLQSEPNLRKLLNANDVEDCEIYMAPHDLR